MNLTVKCARPLTDLEANYVEFAARCKRLNHQVPAEIERFLSERDLGLDSKQTLFSIEPRRQSEWRWIVTINKLPKEVTHMILEWEE